MPNDKHQVTVTQKGFHVDKSDNEKRVDELKSNKSKATIQDVLDFLVILNDKLDDLLKTKS